MILDLWLPFPSSKKRERVGNAETRSPQPPTLHFILWPFKTSTPSLGVMPLTTPICGEDWDMMAVLFCCCCLGVQYTQPDLSSVWILAIDSVMTSELFFGEGGGNTGYRLSDDQ